MDKLLHERLKELENWCQLYERYNIREVSFTKLMESFADEIERYYIPRPRFEDGEPVQDSDLEEIGAMATCCVFTDGSWRFDPDKYEDERNPKTWDKQEGRQCDRIKRPTPKVYDADGVEIKVGETVWDIEHGYKFSAIEVNQDEIKVKHHSVTAYVMTYQPDQLTHREPDSLEKLRDDMVMTHDAADEPCSTTEEWIDRLTALIERGA